MSAVYVCRFPVLLLLSSYPLPILLHALYGCSECKILSINPHPLKTSLQQGPSPWMLINIFPHVDQISIDNNYWLSLETI